MTLRRTTGPAVLTGLLAFSTVHAPAGAGELLVSGWASDTVGRYDPESGAFLGLLEPGVGLNGSMSVTAGPDGRLYVCSELTNRVLRYHRGTGDFIDVFVEPGNGLNGPTAALFGPDFDDDGDADLYVASFNGDAVLVYDGATGDFLDVFVSVGSGGLNGPDAGMAFGPDGDLYVPSFWNHRVLRYDDEDGSFVEAFVGPGSGGLSNPRTIAFRPSDGHAVVTSEGNGRVLVYHGETGAPIGTLVEGLPGPTGMRFAADGSLYVASLPLNAVHRFDGDTGGLIDVVVPSGAGGLSAPTYVTIVPPAADITGDGTVDVQDLVALITAWGACPPPSAACPSDLDNDGVVGVGDLIQLILSWA